MTMPRLALLLLLFASVSCTTFHRSPGVSVRAEAVGAKYEAEDYVRLIKYYYRPSALEYRQAALLYGRLRSNYECWLEGAIEALEERRNPGLETKYLGCVQDAPSRRDDFEEYVRAVVTSPRAEPQPNSSISIPTAAKITKALESATNVLVFFDKFADAWIKLYERYKNAGSAERKEQIEALRAMHWKNFEDIR